MKVKTKVKAGPRDCGGVYIWDHEEHDMKIKTKVKAGPRDCAIYIWDHEGADMKVKTKVKAGPRDCGPVYIWAQPSTARRQRRTVTKEPDMKIKTKVKAGPGRDCGGGGGPTPIEIGIWFTHIRSP